MSRHKLDAREALLTAAERLFAHRGYACISTREIAERAGVNLGLIGYYFGSKQQLFVEVVQRILRGREAVTARDMLQTTPSPSDPAHAAVILSRFIKSLMCDLLQARGEQLGIIYREMLGRDSEPEVLDALLSIMATELMEPILTGLVNVMAVLAPTTPRSELWLAAQGVIGQCVFYLTHRPCLERLAGRPLTEAECLEGTAKQVALFSLRSVQCNEQAVERALDEVFPSLRRPKHDMGVAPPAVPHPCEEAKA